MNTKERSKARTARAAPGNNHGAKVDGREEVPKSTPREQLVLFTIGYQERYGLEIQQAIEDCSDGAESISIGSLYPVLHSLERKGLVSARYGDKVVKERSGARRRYYRLTAKGEATIKAIQEFQNRLLRWTPS